ncbi:hypothetical protein [Flavobacterium sp. JP2137]|uniref:hypothetical protein n=1 Tax=Flavobacterium sp. JP2137 TaxID=3414510 RepID=UPI003D2FB37A
MKVRINSISKMKIKCVYLFVYLTFFSLTSCGGVLDLTNDYGVLTEDWKEIIVPLKSFEEVKREQITKINGYQLKEELKRYPKALVYVISNQRQEIVSLRELELQMYERKCKLFLVMDGYLFVSSTFNQPVYSPIFSIDNGYYNKKYKSTYKRYFINDMLGNAKLSSRVKKDDFLYYFEDGVLKKSGKYSLLNDLAK